MTPSSGSADAPADIDLRRVVARLWFRRWWMAAAVVLCTAGFAGAAFTMTPVYRATTVLVSASVDRGGGSLNSLGQLGGLAALAGLNVGAGATQTEESLAVLKSREFTEAFIRDEGLMPELFQASWDSRAKQWKGPADRIPTLARGFKYFDSDIRLVSRDKATGLVSVRIEWRDPGRAAEWANKLVEHLNAEMRARAIADTAASVGYLERELAATSTIETRQAIARLMEAQINQRMLANVTQEYAFRVVDQALPADIKDVVRPNKVLLLLLGPIAGIIFGAITVLLVSGWSKEH